ncbi:MAG: hypothetical protein ACAF41_32640 [Leptolyngbya sp. BL-A-14]
MAGRKEAFNKWFVSVSNNLKSQYLNWDLDIGTVSLQNKHWYQLWRIFESHVECSHKGAKEQMESLEAADYEARKVVLSAHGQSASDLDWKVQMDHYMNSGNYD